MNSLKSTRIIRVIDFISANIVKTSFFIILLLTTIGLVGCSDLQKSSIPKHIYPYNEKHTLTDFTEEEKKSILDAFNVVFPDEEAKITAFCFEEEKYKSGGVLTIRWTFVLEIDGVEDYETFFESNNSRGKINEYDGLSMNELLDLYPPEYYITYVETALDYPEEAYEEIESYEEYKKMLSNLKKCYDDLSEKRIG